MVGIHPYLVEIMMRVVLMGEMGITRSPYIKAMHKGIDQMKVYLPNLSRSTPRPYMPTFFDAQRRDTNALNHESLGDEWETAEREYKTMNMGFMRHVSIGEYFYIKIKRESKDCYRGDNELGRKAGRMELSTFDGSNQISATTWVKKMDTYLQLNTMEEGNAIKFSKLYLMGKTHDWWFDGMTTLGHENINSYREFTQRLIDRFDREDPKLHFRDLTQILQIGSIETSLRSFRECQLWFLMCQNTGH
jgi:hypothetical protein